MLPIIEDLGYAAHLILNINYQLSITKLEIGDQGFHLSVKSLFPILANKIAARINGIDTKIAATANIIIRYLETCWASMCSKIMNSLE